MFNIFSIRNLILFFQMSLNIWTVNSEEFFCKILNNYCPQLETKRFEICCSCSIDDFIALHENVTIIPNRNCGTIYTLNIFGGKFNNNNIANILACLPSANTLFCKYYICHKRFKFMNLNN